MAENNSLLVGIDIGGTQVKIGLVDSQGNILAKTAADVAFDHYITPIIETVFHAVSTFIKGLLPEQRLNLSGAAISATGQIDTETGVIIGASGNIPNWQGTNLTAPFETKLNLPAVAANDANCMIIGEAVYGIAKGYDNVVGVTLGTGVGGGVVSHGQLLEGHRGMAGEIGHIPLYAHGIECKCGIKGCAEKYISVTALLSRMRERGFDYPTAALLCEELSDSHPNPAMQQEFDAWVDDIALYLAGLGHIFNPEMFVIGGGISQQQKLLIEPLRKRLLLHLMPGFRPGLRIEPAANGNNAGLLGACAIWRQRHGQA